MPIKAVCSVVRCSCLLRYHWLPFVCMWTCKPIIICAFIVVTCKCTLIQRRSTESQFWQKQRLQIDCMTVNGSQWLPGVNAGKTFSRSYVSSCWMLDTEYIRMVYGITFISFKMILQYKLDIQCQSCSVKTGGDVLCVWHWRQRAQFLSHLIKSYEWLLFYD